MSELKILAATGLRSLARRIYWERVMRKLIAGFKTSIDGKIEGADGYADWVAAWSEDFGLTGQIDACIVGGGMYPGYEKYWTAIQTAGDQPLPMTGKFPTPEEVKWGHFAAQTPHYVLSKTLGQAQWRKTSFLRGVDEVTALKSTPGKDIYLMGGGRVAAALIDGGLVDELRLLVYPLIAGPGKALFATTARRRKLELRKAQQLPDGRVSLVYAIG
jgi:dihydrofolate reductase